MIKLIVILVSFSALTGFTAVEDIFRGQTSIENPFELRDPFQPPKFATQGQRNRDQTKTGVWDNQNRLTEPVKLEDIKITGVLIGTNRRVILKVGERKESYTLKEGETVGPLGPEVKAILPGGIILAEKISNIYGEPEYIETVIPISN